MKTKLLSFAFAAILLPGTFSVQAQKTVLAIAAVKAAGLLQATEEGRGLLRFLLLPKLHLINCRMVQWLFIEA